jgi:hypothetical protein
MHDIMNIFVWGTIFIFVVCSTTAREGYEEDAAYENLREQTFEAEDQQLLNNQGKFP